MKKTYATVNIGDACQLRDRLLESLTGENYGVAELALVMSYLEVMCAMAPLPGNDAELRVRFFLSEAMEHLSTLAVKAQNASAVELREWNSHKTVVM